MQRAAGAAAPTPNRWRLVLFLSLLVLLLGLAIAWSGSPLTEWLNLQTAVATLRVWAQQYGPYRGVAGLTLALLCAVPLSFLTIVAIVAYGPWTGFAIVMASGLLAAAASFEAGKWLGHALLTQLAGPRVNQISQRLAHRGLLAVVAIRLVPIAPFAIVNLIAGSSHIKLRDMLLGTAMGMLPGTLVMALFIDKIVGALAQPGSSATGLLLVALALILGGIVVLARFLKRSN